jgi:hypothetical protein
MLAIEDKQQVLILILKEIAATHPEVRDQIMRRLSQITKPGETITVVNGE